MSRAREWWRKGVVGVLMSIVTKRPGGGSSVKPEATARPEEKRTKRPATAKVETKRVAQGAEGGTQAELSSEKALVVFFGAVLVGVFPADTRFHETAIVLGLVFLVETLWYVIVARLFSISAARATYVRMKKWTDRMFGSVIALFGLKIAIT